ncbi:MAG: DUF6285 domain-containing protein, partial [Limibacillus sp.]
MNDRPNALELLEEAQRLLKEELAPSLQGKQRFHALMVANALGIAGRELGSASERARRWVVDLKALGYSSDEELVAALRDKNSAREPGLY